MIELRDHLRRLAFMLGVLGVVSALFAGALGHTGGFLAVQAWSGRLPPLLWECLTVLGDERVLLAFFLPFAIRHPRAFFAILLAAAMAALLARGIKLWAVLPRPAAVVPPELITIIGPRVTRHAFPSGHTASLFAFFGVVIGLSGLGRYFWTLLLLATLAGISRVAVGAHWPLDVMVGALVGLLAAFLTLAVQFRCRWVVGTRQQAILLWVVLLSTLTLPFEGQGYADSLPLRLAACCWGLAGLAMAVRKYPLPSLKPLTASL